MRVIRTLVLGIIAYGPPVALFVGGILDVRFNRWDAFLCALIILGWVIVAGTFARTNNHLRGQVKYWREVSYQVLGDNGKTTVIRAEQSGVIIERDDDSGPAAEH